MTTLRSVEELYQAKPTLEGAGVRLHRVFGYDEVPAFDPFLMLDDFGSDDPQDYLAGFPWHPHRGIETVTYVIRGEVDHHDSLGNKGTIKDGGVQWMSAGSGIIHEEMPQRYDGSTKGFQLWVNLPQKQKMMKPRYRGIEGSEVPFVEEEGARIGVIAGAYKDAVGPVTNLVVPALYFDVALAAGGSFSYELSSDYSAFIYVFEGEAAIGDQIVPMGTAARLSSGEEFQAQGNAEGARFLFVAGKPLKEPVAWRGPIVMNSQAELRTAFEELKDGTFIKDEQPALD